jgi:NDP-sugar pyrophosphorylase family protein
MILAAGRGERLRPFTDGVPKPLLPLANMPMIEWALQRLRDQGCRRFYVNLHHLGRQIADYLGDGAAYGVIIRYSWEDELLGTGGGIAKMLPWVAGEYFICVNGDSLLMADLKAAWELHVTRQSVATMVVTKTVSETEPTLGLAADGRLIDFLGYQTDQPPQMRAHFTGIHFFKTSFLRQFIEGKGRALRCINRDGYRVWLDAGYTSWAFRDQAPLMDAGTPPRYLAANAYLLDWLAARAMQRYAASSPRPADTALPFIIRPPVVIATDAEIDEGSVIGPHVSIGAGCVVGSDCYLQNCILLPGATVAPHTQLRKRVISQVFSDASKP